VSRSDLSAAADCPEQFLSKVLQHLTRAGLMISHRGNTGGFELESAHRAATLLQVVEAIEGPIKLNICLTSDHGCNRQNWCPAHSVWAKAQQAMIEVLASANIAELAQREAILRTVTPIQPPVERDVVLIDGVQWN
jgi:Rrf2 family protein